MGDRATLAIIGGGNMGAAFVTGLLHGGFDPSGITICEVSEARRLALQTEFPDVPVVDSLNSCSEAIIAVKPGDVSSACQSAVKAGATRVLSIAAGVRLHSLTEACGATIKVVRAMPNTPALVGQACTAFAASANCASADREWARELLSAVGAVVELDETMLDAFTGLIGSGPAYVFYVAEALRDAAVAEGFDPATAADVVSQLFVGAAALLAREPANAADLRRRVTSPNGTTAAGIASLDDDRVRDAFVSAVRAATKRSKELGDA